VLLSLRKVLVLVHEDQFINPCLCPWTSSSCPCRGMLLMTMVFGARKPGSVRYNPVLIAWWWALLFRHNTPLCVSDSVYRAMHMRRAVKVIPEKCPTKIFISQFKKKIKNILDNLTSLGSEWVPKCNRLFWNRDQLVQMDRRLCSIRSLTFIFWVRLLVCLSVCLFVCSQHKPKNEWSENVQTRCREWAWVY